MMCYEESANHDGTIDKMTNRDQQKQKCKDVNVSFVDAIYVGNNVIHILLTSIVTPFFFFSCSLSLPTLICVPR
jgi:hypothetical protein